MGLPPGDDWDYPDFDDAEEIPPRPSKRVPVAIFLLGWLVLPTIVILIGDLSSPWFEAGCALTLAFAAVFVWACVRVVKNF